MTENTKNMKDYPTLKKMGVASPRQIAKYYVTSFNYVDHLRIVYDRPDGTFLPSTRNYKFPQVPEDGASDSDQKSTSSVMRTHPQLKKAVAELDVILAAKATKETIAAEILSEIELLEEEISVRTACLKSLVKKVPALD